jgi:hypothetical protein
MWQPFWILVAILDSDPRLESKGFYQLTSVPVSCFSQEVHNSSLFFAQISWTKEKLFKEIVDAWTDG